MLKQYGFDARLKRIHKNLRPYVPSGAILGAIVLLLLGAGLLYALPDRSAETAAATPTMNGAPAPLASADESFCDKQTWPYIDQRCAARVEAARGSRQVRIVTDKGTSVKTVTPLPVVEQKPAPQPPKPAVAQNDRPIGPSVAPVVNNAQPEPQTTGSVQPVIVSSPSPAASKAMASAPVPPASASNAPVSRGVDAIDETRPKSKSARAAERAEQREVERAKKRETNKREASKRRMIEQDDESGPKEVADTTGGLPERGDRSRSKRARAEVPDEVIEAVEAATARDRGRRVTVDSPRGRRVYVVPRDGAEW